MKKIKFYVFNDSKPYTVESFGTGLVVTPKEYRSSIFHNGDSIDRVKRIFQDRKIDIDSLKPGDIVGKFWGRQDYFKILEIEY